MFGKHLCQKIKRCSLVLPSLFHQYEQAIERFNKTIIENCWKFLAKELKEEEFDENAYLDVFSCLEILSKNSFFQLFSQFVHKVKQIILKSFVSRAHLKSVFNHFLNYVFNAIKVIHLIYFEDIYEGKSQLHRRIDEIGKNSYLISFGDDTIKKSITIFSGETTFERGTFHFEPVLVLGDQSINKQLLKEGTMNWIVSIRNEIKGPIENLLNDVECLTSICLMLTDVDKLINDNERKLEWEEYCEDIMGNYWPFWEEFLMDVIINKILDIINNKITICFDILKKNVNIFLEGSSDVESLEVSCFVWNDSNEHKIVSKKATGYLPEIENICLDFSEILKNIIKDMKMFTSQDTKTPINQQNLVEMNEKWSNKCKNLINDLFIFLKTINKDNTKKGFLFSAHLLRYLSQFSDDFTECSEIKQNHSETKSLLIKEEINSFANFFLLNLFNTIICELIEEEFVISLDPKSNNFFLPWKKIQISDESEDGKIITSNIEIPSHISFPLYNFLNNLCNEINQIAGHTLPKGTLINLLIALSRELDKKYCNLFEQLEKSDYQSNVKQIFALQWYFDMQFVKQFLNTSHNEEVKNEAVQLIHQRMLTFESLIDPFDLHVFFPHIQTTLANISKTCSLSFGLLLPEFIFVTDSMSNSMSNSLHDQNSAGNN